MEDKRIHEMWERKEGLLAGKCDNNERGWSGISGAEREVAFE